MVECGSNHTLILGQMQDSLTGSKLTKAERRGSIIVQLGNPLSYTANEFIFQRRRGKKAKKGGAHKPRVHKRRKGTADDLGMSFSLPHVPISAMDDEAKPTDELRYSALEAFWKGTIIDLNLEEIQYDDESMHFDDSNSKIRRQDLITADSVKFIRAAYGRSCAVTRQGRAIFWGQGFKNEVIQKPKMLFMDKNLIQDLRFGYNHGVYIQKNNQQAYSWGENSYGQTGNHYSENLLNNQARREAERLVEVDKQYLKQLPRPRGTKNSALVQVQQHRTAQPAAGGAESQIDYGKLPRSPPGRHKIGKQKLDNNVSDSSRPLRSGLGHQYSARRANAQQRVPMNHSCELDDSNLLSSPDHLPIKAEYLDS